MNNLQYINKDFNSKNLSKYQYTISLINECIRCEILPKSFLYTVQIKIGEILKDLIVKYTKGESSSVTVEKAEKLIIGIWYTIDAYMNSLSDINLSIKTLKEEKISNIHENGKEILKMDLMHTENLYEKVLENKINTELTAYNDTLTGISDFFKFYNLDFEPDECDASIDYPLAFDDWDVQGLYYMKNYLWNLYMENEICNKFNNDEIFLLLKSYGDNYEIEYRDLLINIFEMTITNSAFSNLCKNNSLEIKEEDFEILNNKLKKLSENQVKSLISFSMEKIIEDYSFNEFEIDYLKKYEKELIKNTLDALKRDNLKNTIVVSYEIKRNINNNITIEEENRLSDEDFRNIIEEILESDNVYEKINIINNKINSINDYLDMLKSNCLFEDEFMLLFMSLNKIELSILCKYVLYNEYRMEKLDIVKTLSKKIHTNHEWEDVYLDYLRSLSNNKLKEIENFINGN